MSNMPFEDRPYTRRELSEVYRVSPKVFRRWVAAIADELGEKPGHFYNLRQLRVIIKHFGFPPGYSNDASQNGPNDGPDPSASSEDKQKPKN